MSEANNSDSSSTSESEVSACSSKFNPVKALYSSKAKAPVKDAPLYENVQHFESSQKNTNVIPFGQKELVDKREKDKRDKKLEEERLLQEKNRQRFAKYELPVPTRRERKTKNVLTRIEAIDGPLSALRECVDHRLRIKVTTHSGRGVRGVLHATLVAFDKQWNLALSDVLEVWTKKALKKRKIPPCVGTPVPKGSAAKISPVPIVTETPLGKGVWECTRHLPQLMVRGEHVVMINIVER